MIDCLRYFQALTELGILLEWQLDNNLLGRNGRGMIVLRVKDGYSEIVANQLREAVATQMTDWVVKETLRIEWSDGIGNTMPSQVVAGVTHTLDEIRTEILHGVGDG